MLMTTEKKADNSIEEGIRADAGNRDRDGWTPTQKRIIKALGDGQWHKRRELEKLLNDDMALAGALGYHIAMIRRKLAVKQEDIVCRDGAYRWVRAVMPGLPPG